MGYEESNHNQDPEDEKHTGRLDVSSLDQSFERKPSVPPTSPDDDQSSEINELKEQLEKLKNQLSIYQDETKEKESFLEERLAELQSKLTESVKSHESEKQLIVKKESELKELDDKILFLEDDFKNKLQDNDDHIKNLEEQLSNTKLKISEIEIQNQEIEKKVQESQATVEKLQLENADINQEKVAYLDQITKLQEFIQTTEEEIKEIEAGHHEIEEQLKLEIKRTEDRAGQISEDFNRETTGSVARNRHIRTVLLESDIGKVVLFIVDYFENSKKRALDLQTLASEVGMTPIIVRSHMRNLHGLGVCNFNEVTREIKLIK